MKEFIDYINNLFGIENETSATIIITLSIFILGFILTWLFNFVKAEFRRKSLRKFFRALLKEVALTSGRQAKYFIDFSDNLNIEYEGQFTLKSTPINHLDNIQKLSIENIYDAFYNGIRNLLNKKIRRKAFNKIWIHISSLEFWEQRQVENLEKFIKKFNEYEDKRNEEIENWRRISDQMMHQVSNQNISKELAPYFEEYGRIVYNWQSNGQSTHYKVVQEVLIEPLRALNRKYRDIPFTLSLNIPLLGVTNYYNNLNVFLEVHKSIYWSQYITYKAASRMITKSIEII